MFSISLCKFPHEVILSVHCFSSKKNFNLIMICVSGQLWRRRQGTVSRTVVFRHTARDEKRGNCCHGRWREVLSTSEPAVSCCVALTAQHWGLRKEAANKVKHNLIKCFDRLMREYSPQARARLFVDTPLSSPNVCRSKIICFPGNPLWVAALDRCSVSRPVLLLSNWTVYRLYLPLRFFSYLFVID